MRLDLTLEDARRTWDALSAIDDIVTWACALDGAADTLDGDTAFGGTVLGFSTDGETFRVHADGEDFECSAASAPLARFRFEVRSR